MCQKLLISPRPRCARNPTSTILGCFRVRSRWTGGPMADDVRYQRKCFYASPEYSASFWGKFIYIYQGRGSLRLTANSLCLEDCPQSIEIPFHAVKSIRLDHFSSWAKPFGLSRLTVC